MNDLEDKIIEIFRDDEAFTADEDGNWVYSVLEDDYESVAKKIVELIRG